MASAKDKYQSVVNTILIWKCFSSIDFFFLLFVTQMLILLTLGQGWVQYRFKQFSPPVLTLRVYLAQVDMVELPRKCEL